MSDSPSPVRASAQAQAEQLAAMSVRGGVPAFDAAEALPIILAAEARGRQQAQDNLQELLVRADSYLSLLWHRHVPPERKDTDLEFHVNRTIGDLRTAAKGMSGRDDW